MMLFFIVSLVILICGSGFLSASETSLFSLSSMRVKAFSVGKDPKGKQVAQLLAEPRKLLVTILMLNVLMNILVQNVVATIFGAQASLWINVGVPLALTLFFGEMIPKALAYAHNHRLARFVAPFFIFAEKVLGPIRNVIGVLTGWVSRWMFFFLRTETGISIEELKVALSTSKQQRILGEEEAKLVRGYLNLEEDLVKEVLRPRSEMLTFDLAEPVEHLLQIFVDEQITRVPVIEGSQENVIGIIRAKDFFLHQEKIDSSQALCTYLIPPFFVPESMSSKLLLRQFFARGESLAIVVDEYGALAGLVTSEDLVELVLGQINDNRDKTSHYTKASKDIVIASGKLELIEFEELFDVHLNSPHNMATIGGWLTEHIGEIPQAGEKITLHGFLFHILAADSTHVKRLYIRRLRRKK